MKLKIVSIGNSRGVRIPKPLLEQAGIENEVEIEADGNALVLRSVKKAPRQGWGQAFEQMAEHGDDQLLDAERMITQWEQDEWEWK